MKYVKQVNISQSRTEKLLSINVPHHLDQSKISIEIFYPHLGVSMSRLIPNSISLFTNIKKDDLIIVDDDVFNFQEPSNFVFYPGAKLIIKINEEVFGAMDFTKSPLGSKVYTIDYLDNPFQIIDIIGI